MDKNTTKSHNLLLEDYFNDYEIRPEFKKEFVSLWKGWLGKENYYKLDQVTESEWERFNSLIRNISKCYKLLLVNLNEKTILEIDDIDKTLNNYNDSMNKPGSEFFIFIIPELDCVITEEFDYTFIIWHKHQNTIEKLKPFILESNLHHFSD
ncbi:hypothetical protein [Flavobacterium sp. GT3R68]|uniref:hypothetical protein n=1 Tax=Flavobacterium sp. GT3R68 TaxID=2594437 RepID=UPI000F86771A|nr:hypothetical protein [Flavobacterium sp. GT3R68]RTY85911.1 hypothetical protein EKL32_28240 [Flavobacterium sp. GSN2]TRW89345.1 hypothetical protein FNW07_13520 [Flavobacterium sp. GT3R68]